MAPSECACAASRHWHRTKPASCDHRPYRAKDSRYPASDSSTSSHRRDCFEALLQLNEPSRPRQPVSMPVRGHLPNRVASSMLAPVPSMELESEIIPNGNPDSDKKQHALVALAAACV